jgi:ABC-type transporter Mla subunit MlaD
MPGKRSQNREAFWGGIALAILTLLFLLIFFAADVRRMLTRTDDLYVLMPSASGLSRGSLVWIAGQPVGEVEDIEVRPPSAESRHRVLLRIKVERRHREHIRRDSQARITSFRVIGDPVLDITPGHPRVPGLEPNDTIRFRAAGTPEAAIARARALHTSLQALLADARIVNERVEARRERVARVGDHLTTAGRELRELTVTLQSGPLNTLSDPEFNRIMGELGETVAELRNSFVRAFERARATRSEAEPALRRLSARADTISQAITELQQVIAQSGGGLLTRAMTDSAIFKALHGAQAQLDSLIVETKRSPWRYWLGR